MQQIKQWVSPKACERTEVVNPIRSLLEKEFKIPAQPPKPMINLALGEAKKEEGFGAPDTVKQALIDAINSDQNNGYTASNGLLVARQAISQYFSHPRLPPIDPGHVILTAGTSGALYTAITSLCEKGSNILMPQPGFPLCGTICENLGVSVKKYRLLPESEWQIDLSHVQELADDNTAAILVNNPSNPCGSVFSESHMKEILSVAEKLKLPIIADQVYYGMAYDKSMKFIPFAHVGADHKEIVPKVPIISVCALSKIYCIPGWRLGWIIFHDQHDYFKYIIQGALRVCQIWLHPQTPLQAALPAILGHVPDSYMDDFLKKLSIAADYVYSEIREKLADYLIPVRTRGAMYMMLQIRLEKLDASINSDVEFAQTLVNEQGVLMLPGKCFSAPGFVRVVLCHGKEFFSQMIERLRLFCEEHKGAQ